MRAFSSSSKFDSCVFKAVGHTMQQVKWLKREEITCAQFQPDFARFPTIRSPSLFSTALTYHFSFT